MCLGNEGTCLHVAWVLFCYMATVFSTALQVAKVLSQHCDKKLKLDQTRKVIKKTARPACERRADIEEKVCVFVHAVYLKSVFISLCYDVDSDFLKYKLF